MIENFFNEEIEKTVFLSTEQLMDTAERKLYGRYYADTCIFNVFPEALRERGGYLCSVLPEGSVPTGEGLI